MPTYPSPVTMPKAVDVSVDAMIEDLRTLVEVESPSRDLDALRKSAGTVAAVVESRLGGKAVLVESEGGPHVHWSGGGTPRVLILGHHDTVFPLGTLARRPFLVEDGRASGPGVFDMLGGLVQAIHGLAALDDRSASAASPWIACTSPPSMSKTPGPVTRPSSTRKGRRASVPSGNTVSW